MLRTLAAFVDFLAVLRHFQGTPRGGESTSPPGYTYIFLVNISIASYVIILSYDTEHSVQYDELAHDKDHWRALINVGLNLQVTLIIAFYMFECVHFPFSMVSLLFCW